MDYVENREPEEWRIINEVPYYKISSWGNVQRFIRGNKSNMKPLNVNLNQQLHNGYLIIKMKYDGKLITRSVHRLVAIAFVPNPEFKEEVNHDDLNKQNNYYKNLVWSTPMENTHHAIDNDHYRKRAVLQFDQQGNFIKEHKEVLMAAKEIGVDSSNIIAICKGRENNIRNFTFKYKTQNV